MKTSAQAARSQGAEPWLTTTRNVEEIFAAEHAAEERVRDERAALARRLEELFTAATKRFRPPSLEDCEGYASLLMYLAYRAAQRIRGGRGGRVNRCAKEFLGYLEGLRGQLHARMPDVFTSQFAAGLGLRPEPPLDTPMDAEPWVLAYGLLENAREAVVAVLPFLLQEPPPEDDLIRILAKWACIAWAEANEGDAPRGTNPDNPLVRFVTVALAEVGISHSAETVSAVLRGRRRTKRKDKSGP